MHITTPVIHELGSPPSRDDRTGLAQLVEQLARRPGRPDELSARSEPVVQPWMVWLVLAQGELFDRYGSAEEAMAAAERAVDPPSD